MPAEAAPGGRRRTGEVNGRGATTEVPLAEAAKAQAQKQEKETLSPSVPVELAERFRDVAFHERRSLSGLIEEAMEQYLARFERQLGQRVPSRGGASLPVGRPMRGRPGGRSRSIV
jgi:hypothetical protein